MLLTSWTRRGLRVVVPLFVVLGTCGTAQTSTSDTTYFVFKSSRGDSAGLLIPEWIVVGISDASTVADARRLMASHAQTWVIGTPIAGDGGFNVDPSSQHHWLWHLAPAPITFAGATAEGIQGSPSAVDQNLAYWLTNVQRCAFDGTFVAEGLPTNRPRLSNGSLRAWIGPGAEAAIYGIVIDGTNPKTLLVRASGPALEQFGISDYLPRPRLEIHDSSGTVVASSIGWDGTPQVAATMRDAFQRTGAFDWKAGSADTALLVSLMPGLYTAVVEGDGGSSGVVLTEVYDMIDVANTRLINSSGRCVVKSGNQVQITGITIAGPESQTILVRAIGPGLAKFGVAGPLADPILEVRDLSGRLVVTNDDWNADAGTGRVVADAAVKSGAFALGPASKDAAALVTLPPGSYTILIRGKNADSGTGLVEVYDVSK